MQSFLIVFLLTTSSLAAIEVEEIEIENEDVHVLQNSIYDSKDWVIRLPSTHKLVIEVEHMDLVNLDGDYLLIKRGPEFETDSDGIVFTGKDYQDFKPILISSSVVYLRLRVHIGPKTEAQFNATAIRAAPPKLGFVLRCRALGSVTITTTETPVSTTTFPTPSIHDKAHYTVHIAGRPDYEYSPTHQSLSLLLLKRAIRDMAIDYCKDNNIPLDPNHEITENNVQITDLVRCPYGWPDSQNCVEVKFALPVFLVKGKDGEDLGYELNAMHLEIMWQRHNEKLVELELRNYEIKDLDTRIVWWNILLGFTIAGVVIGVIAIAIINQIKPNLFKCGTSANEEDKEEILEEEHERNYIPNESEYDKFYAYRNTEADRNTFTEKFSEA